MFQNTILDTILKIQFLKPSLKHVTSKVIFTIQNTIFKIQFLKPILKHVTSKLIVQKQQFYEQFERFFENYISIIMVSRYSREHLRQIISNNFFIEAFIY